MLVARQGDSLLKVPRVRTARKQGARGNVPLDCHPFKVKEAVINY